MKQQINALTATRAVAAILVVIHHFGADLFPFTLARTFFNSGNVAVSYFFVLSGFVLYLSYSGVEVSYGDYLKRRIGRIVPVYLFALALTTLVAVQLLSYPLVWKSCKEIMLSALFLQAYVPAYPLVLNSPAWTLSVEMFFYVTFPLFLLIIDKDVRLFAGLALILYAGALYYHQHYYLQRWSLPDSIVDTVFFNPVMHISQFLTGMLGGYMFRRRSLGWLKQWWWPPALFVVMVLAIGLRPEHISYHVGLIAPLFLLFVLSVAVNNPKPLNARWFVYLGEISYGIYILQHPVYKGLRALNAHYVHMPPQYFFYAAMAALILAASVTYHVIEKPMRRMVNRMRLG